MPMLYAEYSLKIRVVSMTMSCKPLFSPRVISSNKMSEPSAPPKSCPAAAKAYGIVSAGFTRV
jgi:hypothetical protein